MGQWPTITQLQGAAGVVVSCKIPILATRVRFPGGAFFSLFIDRFLGFHFDFFGKRE